jgi:hypothetical protein
MSQGAINAAVGEGAAATMGSVQLSNTDVKGEITNNATMSQGAINAAVGKNSEAPMGAVQGE